MVVPPRRDHLDRSDQLRPIVQAVLQDVAASGGAVLEQAQGVPGVRVLAEDDDAERRMRAAHLACDPDALVVTSGWHADVGDDHVRRIRLERGEETLAVGERGDELDLVDRCQDLPDRLADQVRIVGEDDADRAVTVRGSRSRSEVRVPRACASAVATDVRCRCLEDRSSAPNVLLDVPHRDPSARVVRGPGWSIRRAWCTLC